MAKKYKADKVKPVKESFRNFSNKKIQLNNPLTAIIIEFIVAFIVYLFFNSKGYWDFISYSQIFLFNFLIGLLLIILTYLIKADQRITICVNTLLWLGFSVQVPIKELALIHELKVNKLDKYDKDVISNALIKDTRKEWIILIFSIFASILLALVAIFLIKRFSEVSLKTTHTISSLLIVLSIAICLMMKLENKSGPAVTILGLSVVEFYKIIWIAIQVLLISSNKIHPKKKWWFSAIATGILCFELIICSEFGTTMILASSWIIIFFLLYNNKKAYITIISCSIVLLIVLCGFSVTLSGRIMSNEASDIVEPMEMELASIAESKAEKKRLEDLLAESREFASEGKEWSMPETTIEAKGESQEEPNFIERQINKVKTRFINWNNPFSDSITSVQPYNAYKAIMLGGLFGSSTEQYIEVAESDMVYSAILLRYGGIYGIIILFIYYMLFNRGLSCCNENNTSKSSIMDIAGICCITIISTSAFISIMGNLNLIPLAGIVLPFLSSGGTAHLIHLTLIIIVVICSSNQKDKLFNKSSHVSRKSYRRLKSLHEAEKIRKKRKKGI